MRKLLLACLMLQMIASCGKKNDGQILFLKFTQQTVTLSPYSSSIAVVLESNTDWTITSSSNDWVTLNKTAGKGNDTILVTVIKANTTTQTRTVTLTAKFVSTSLLPSQVTIEQKAVNVQLAFERAYGGSSVDYINAIVKTPDGGLLIAGRTKSSKNGDVGGTLHGADEDFWVAKLNSNMDTVWTRSIGGSLREWLNGATLTADGGFALAGLTLSSQTGDVGLNNGGSDWYIVKLKSNGDIGWTRVIGGTSDDEAYAIANTPDGGLVVAGKVRSFTNDQDGRVVKLNSNGDVVWQKDFGGTGMDNITSVAVTAGGSILVAGSTLANNTGDIGASHGYYDMWVMKLTGNGDKEWSRLYGGKGFDGAYAITATADGGCAVAGSTLSVDQDIVGKNHVSTQGTADGSRDMWIVKLNASGDIAWSNLLGGPGADDGTGIATTADGGYIAVGYSADPGRDIEKNQGSSDYWVTRLSNEGSKIWSKTFGSISTEVTTTVAVTADNNIYVGGYIYSWGVVDGDVKSVRGNDDGWLIKLKDY